MQKKYKIALPFVAASIALSAGGSLLAVFDNKNENIDALALKGDYKACEITVDDNVYKVNVTDVYGVVNGDDEKAYVLEVDDTHLVKSKVSDTKFYH